MIRKTITICPAEGLTPRVAARLVRYAQECACKIECETPNGCINMKSLMALLSLGLGGGERLTAVFDGEDEAAAAQELERLLTEGEN